MITLNETQPNNMFFDQSPMMGVGGQTEQKSTSKSEDMGNEFVGRSSNIELTEPYNIRFTIGSGTFQNIISLIHEIGYDVMFRFRKKELVLFIIDPSTTHATEVHVDKIEFTSYDVEGLEKDDDEISVFIDTSVMSSDYMTINEQLPVDFYVDTKVKNRFYVVNGRETNHRRLNSTADVANPTVAKYKGFEVWLKGFLKNTDYQKVVINEGPLKGAMISLNKKKVKKEGENTLAELLIKKNPPELNFNIEDEVKGSKITLFGTDMLVCPVNEDKLIIALEFFNKFGRLKLSYNVSMYICGVKVVPPRGLPVIMETRLGGGKITLWYLVAPRDDS